MITSFQISAARGIVRMSKEKLAEAAGLSYQTIKLIELGNDSKASTLRAIQAALEAAGVEFIDRGVRLREVA